MILRTATLPEIRWLEQQAPCNLTANAKVITADGSKTLPLAVVAFDGWTENAAWVHLAVTDPRIFFGRTIHEVWDWVFSHVGVLLSTVRASNGRSLRFQRGLGFSEVCRIRDGYAPDEDLVIMQLRREDARHGGKNGRSK